MELSHVLFHFISAAVHCNFFPESASQNAWFIHYGGSRSIDQLCENEHLPQWLPSFNVDNISRSSIWSTGALENTRSAPENRGRMSLWLPQETPLRVKDISVAEELQKCWLKKRQNQNTRCRDEFAAQAAPFSTVLKVVLIKPSWQMFLEVLVRHEKSSWLIEAM